MTVTFAVVDATGELVRAGSAPEDQVDIQAGPGETLLRGPWPPAGSYWSAGDGAWLKKPERPSSEHRWDAQLKEWVDPRSFQDLKDAKWAEVKVARDAAEFGGFAWGGSWFDSDEVSQSRIQGASQLAMLAAQAGQPFAIDWTLADNTVRSLTGGEMIAVGTAMGEHITDVHAMGRTLRAAIEAATTGEQLDGITWPAEDTTNSTQ